MSEDQDHDAALRTGDPRVDAVLDSLASLDELPVDEHPEAYERIHGALRAVLSHAGDDAAVPDAAADGGAPEAP